MTNAPIVIAHRGASAYEPENTLRAFALAIEQGAQMIELDLHRTRDGHVVLARIGSAFPVKRLHFDEVGRVFLLSDNEAYAPIEITEEMVFEVWGRVLHWIQEH